MTPSAIFESINRLSRQLERVPRLSEIAEDLDVDINVLRQTISEMKTGASNIEIAPDEPGVTEAKIIEPIAPETSKPKKAFPIVYIIRICMAIIAGMAAIVAGYLVIANLIEWTPPIIAVILGLAITGFMIGAFEVSLYFFSLKERVFSQKWFSSKGLGLFFMALWLVVEIFTFKSSISGFYGYYAVSKASKTVQTTDGHLRSQMQSLKTTEKQLDTSITNDQKLIALYTVDLETKKKFQNQFDSAVDRVSENSKLKKENSEAQKLIQIKIDATGEKGPDTSSIASFEDWVAVIFGWNSDLLQLIEAILPSAFIDLIASIGFAVALFLGKRDDSTLWDEAVK